MAANNTTTVPFPTIENILYTFDKSYIDNNDTTLLPVVPVEDGSQRTLVSASTHRIFEIGNYVILSGLVGLFGTVANVVNMVVFGRIGIFTSVSNLNLFSLAIADFCVAFTVFLQSIGYAFITADLQDLNVNIFDVVYLTISYPNMIFVMASRMMTPFIAFERCMCVVFPFKVKTLFTTRRSVIFISVIFTYGIVIHIPIFATHKLRFVFQESTNTSKLILVFLAHSDLVITVVNNTNDFVISFTTVVLVLIFTLVTGSTIKTSSEWRKSVSITTTTIATSTTTTTTTIATNTKTINSHGCKRIIVKKDSNSIPASRSGGDIIGGGIEGGNCLHDSDIESQSRFVVDAENHNDNIDAKISPKLNIARQPKMSDKAMDKERRLVKMISTVSVIYLVLYLPEFVMIVAMLVDKRIDTYSQYWRLSEILYSFTSPATALNSSINIIVYYRMSSAFRRQFRKSFGMKEE